MGYANYNGLELSLQGNFQSGASFSANYVYSKALDILTTEELPPEAGRDLSIDYGLADFNQKHVIKLSGVYPLPFGAGRRFLNSNWIEKQVGGWNVSGIFSMNGVSRSMSPPRTPPTPAPIMRSARTRYAAASSLIRRRRSGSILTVLFSPALIS
jgi:hypothetical protein